MPENDLILADLDIVIRAFDRARSDLLIIDSFRRLVEARRLILLGWVRQNVLAFARGDSHFRRLLQALQPFPDVPVRPLDHLQAARRRHLAPVSGAQGQHYLLWVIAERIGGRIWSRDPRWRRLAERGCPLAEDLPG